MPRALTVAEPMGLRFERSVELGAARRIEPSPALIVPLEASVVALGIGEAKALRVDRASFALVPAKTHYHVRALSPVTGLLTLVVGPAARALMEREYRGDVDAKRFTILLATARAFPRTRWVDELVQRYLFEREVCEKDGSMAARFLETEITKELYFMCRERDEMQTRASVIHEESDVARRARDKIEENLFLPLGMGELARYCHVSESTLLRAFLREHGSTPIKYARERRLDAALLLLQSGRYSVGEVAERVGYGGLAAFTVAFRRRFDTPPSSVRRGPPTLETLPAHGAPPRRKRRSL